jgi:plastocyanin
MSRSLFRTRAAIGPRALKRRKMHREHNFWANQPALVEYLEDRTLLSTTEVDVINDSFSPNSVTINVGDVIHFVWKGSDHSTTSVSGSAVSWDSGVHNAGFTFDVTFNQSGTFNYYCKIHGFDNHNGTAGGMSGSIIVAAGATLSSIAVSPASPSVAAGLTEPFTATGTYSDNSTANITNQVTWASSNTSIATISNSSGSAGVATTKAQGSTTISATLGSITGNTTLTVTPAVLESIAVTPPNPNVPKGETKQFIATGTYSDNSTQVLTSQVAWGSSNTAVATISNAAGSQGSATAVSIGTSSITAGLSGISGSTTMTVSAAVVTSIAVTPANPNVPEGETQQFTATGTFSDNSTADITGQVTWSSSATSVATISNTSGSKGLANAVALGSSTITAALSGVSNTATMTVIAAALQSVAIAPVNPSVPKGEKKQFTATGTYSDNSTADVTSQVTWSSSTTGVATISNAAGSQGQASALAIGTSTIMAALSGFSDTTTLTVVAPALESIAIAPQGPSVPKGKTQQFTATGTYSDDSTADITTQVSWTSSATAVATISNAAGSQGLASALTTGTSTIGAALDGVSSSTTLTVSAAVLQSIAVTPANPTVPKGETEQFTATGTFSDSSTSDITAQVNWTSSATGVASISNTTGSNGLASTLAIGTSTISAALGGVTNSTTLTVSAAVLQSIAVTPANPVVAKGETEQFTATGTYSDNSTADNTTQVSWTSSATAVATISNTQGSQGLATSLTTGSSTITASLNGVSKNTTLTVSAAALQSIAVTPANPSVPKGETEQFTATGTFSDHTTSDITTQVTWASSTTAVATISNTAGSRGLATALGIGLSTITATMGSVTNSTTLTVTAPALDSINITPANPAVTKGQDEQFTATGTFSDSSTSDITTQVIWASSATNVATISNASGTHGLATTLSSGSSTISAALSGVSSSTTLLVRAALESIAITPANPSVPKGVPEQFTATATFSDNSTADVTTEVTWSSSATGVATISNAAGSQGLASSLATGNSTITAALNGISSNTTLTVSAAVLQSIAVSPANPSVPKGDAEQFTATGTFSDHTTSDVTNLVNWASSATAIATISNTQGSQGRTATLATGSSTITAALDGVSNSTTLTVSVAVLRSIAVRPVNPSVPKGDTEQFTATGTFSDNSTSDITTAVDWTSSATAVASISNAAGSLGLASALATGNSTITAALDGVSSNTAFTVSAAVLRSIAITPANPSVPKGGTQQFTATGTFSDNSTSDITTQADWTSSATGVATISNTEGSQGLAAALATGDLTITAALDGVSTTTALTVSAAVLRSIVVTPANPGVPKGETEQFTATGTFSDQSIQDVTSQVTWASSVGAIATISNSATSQGLSTGIGTGVTTISAASSGISGSTTLTITAPVLESITITPDGPSVPKGEIEHFTATGLFSDQSTADVTTQVTWASSSTLIATISNAAGSQGTAAAIAIGSSTISATSQSISSTTTITVSAAVLQSIAVTPANPTIAKGETKAFAATGTYSDQSTQDLTGQVAWSSSKNNVSTISNSPGGQGVAAAVAVGQATINAMFDGISGSTNLTVTAAKLVSILILPTVPNVPDGELQVYKATGTLSDNTTEDLTNQVIWASANQAVATISNDPLTRGVATSLSPGSTTITATLDGITGSAVLDVGPKVLEMIMISPTNPSITVGGTESFMAMGMFSDQSMIDYTASVTWSSSATNVAMISNDAGNQGVATGHGPGTSTITASFDGMSGTTSITVTAPPPPPLVVVTSIHDTLNKKHQVTGITVAFSGVVNANLATSVANFRLAMPGKKGSFDAKNAKLIKLKSAVYNAALDQVVLTPKKPFALSKPVQLRVNGLAPAGLEDSDGRLIDGNHDGQPGGNATAVLSRKGATQSAIPVSMGNSKTVPASAGMGTMGSSAMKMMAIENSSIADAVAMSLAADSLATGHKGAASRLS